MSTELDIFKDLDSIFEEVKDQEMGGYENLPDGEYLVEMSGCELTTSKAGKPMAVTAVTVVHVAHAGHVHKIFNVLTGDTLDKTKSAVNRFAVFAKSTGAVTTGGLQGTVESVDALTGQTKKLILSTSDKGWASATLE